MIGVDSSKEAAYTSLEDDDLVEASVVQPDHIPQRKPTLKNAAYVLVLLGCSLATFFAGRYTSHADSELGRSLAVPRIPSTAITFEADPNFSDLSNQESDVAWTSLMPAGEGFVLVQEAQSYGLPPGRNSTTSTRGSFYDISAFHQLHCLIKIREHVSLLRFAVSSKNSSVADRAWEQLLKPQENHMGHCFDYLRQGIMCAGDMTLEWPKVGSQGVVDGWGVAHRCRSWDAILGFVNSHGGR